jgi:5-(carboxyamino)imidazole ribonucleotide mutase
MSQPLVGIVMGSDSDLPVMKEAAGILDELKISWEAVISSAHRVPEKTAAYARGAAGRGLAAPLYRAVAGPPALSRCCM